MRKRIAVIVAQVDETTQRRFLHGFTKEAYAHDYDICIFSMFQKFQETPQRNIGDSNIYNLINYDLFDGIVILSDTLQIPELAKKIEKKVNERYDGPVVIIDQKSEIFESIMMDHYTPVKKLVDHLIEEHGYENIAYLGGKEGHPHSVQRYKAYLDSMRNHKLNVREEWIYHGNYWYDSAEAFVDILVQDRENMPRAIVCASDIMAIGAAGQLAKYGLQVPEDVALVGYDSIDDGRNSPLPLTSAEIPADECGTYTLLWLHSHITGQPMVDFVSKAPLFIGGSCGCPYEVEMVPKKLRDKWTTEQSTRGMYSDFNHLLEDLISQTSMEDFWYAFSSYIYQIMPFHSFDICMNNIFLQTDKIIGENAIRKGYTNTMCTVLSCEEGRDNVIDFDNLFSTSIMSPRLFEDRDYPTAFIFNPIFFEDRCFGYSVLNYGKENRVNDKNFRIWMRDIMQGMEAFYRQQYLQDLIGKMKADQIRDSLTGLYNYEGFLRKTLESIGDEYEEDKQLNIITVDIKGMKMLNEFFGREYGDKTISNMARFINESAREGITCARLCNDEFLISIVDDSIFSRSGKFINRLKAKITEYNSGMDSDHHIHFHQYSSQGKPKDEATLERLVNYTISVKNHAKSLFRDNANAKAEKIEDEIKYHQLVSHVLNENLLTYHYQPIINVKDGSVYAYEALMRSDEEGLNPFRIIQSAKYLHRMDDIERCTLLNVTKDVVDNIELFKDAKVFINSLPNHQLSGNDDLLFEEITSKNSGRFVIEYVEEAELSDDELIRLKEKHDRLGNQIAIDDFGAGYSNVNNLLRYKPDYVKIDRELISDIHKNPQKEHFVKNTIEYAHNNNILALAEGVENKEELRKCIRLGIDLIQGYYTGRPKREPIGVIPRQLAMEIERFYNQKSEW